MLGDATKMDRECGMDMSILGATEESAHIRRLVLRQNGVMYKSLDMKGDGIQVCIVQHRNNETCDDTTV